MCIFSQCGIIHLVIQSNAYYVNIIRTEKSIFYQQTLSNVFFFYYCLYIEILDFISFMVAIIIKKI